MNQTVGSIRGFSESYPCGINGIVAADAEGSGFIAQSWFGNDPGSITSHSDHSKEMDKPFALMKNPEAGSAEVNFFCSELLAQSFLVENPTTGILVPA